MTLKGRPFAGPAFFVSPCCARGRLEGPFVREPLGVQGDCFGRRGLVDLGLALKVARKAARKAPERMSSVIARGWAGRSLPPGLVRTNCQASSCGNGRAACGLGRTACAGRGHGASPQMNERASGLPRWLHAGICLWK